MHAAMSAGWLVVLILFVVVWAFRDLLYFRRKNGMLLYAAAVRRAQDLNRPLLVIGDPATGSVWTRFVNKWWGPEYGYGDLCMDLTGCPGTNGKAIAGDIVQTLDSVDTNSHVVFARATLEFVSDLPRVVKNLERIAGDLSNIFVVPCRRLLPFYFEGSSVFRRRYSIVSAPPFATAFLFTSA